MNLLIFYILCLCIYTHTFIYTCTHVHIGVCVCLCVWSVQKVSCYVIWKLETFIEEDTRNIVHRTRMPQSPSKQAPWELAQFSQLLSVALLYFPECHWWSEISSLSKVNLVLGKPKVTGCEIWAAGWLSHLGHLMFPPKTLHEMWCMSMRIVVMKLPITSCP